MSSLENLDWTKGGDSSLLPSRRIASGGYGDVYELYDIPTGESFARKLLRQGLISITPDDIKNEERAIKKLCGKPTHKNIVEVLRLGDLFNSPYYFIDMELCDLTLEDYIYRDPDLPIQTSTPRFVTSAPSEVKALQIWNIMREITSGLEFIHRKEEIHRDLKPSNILYSRKHSAWKIADFGFATQGTSQTMHTSKARGSSCYRAPETLKEDSGRVSNKADIWSLGCIMYELAVRQKAFNSDIAVFCHSMSGTKLSVEMKDSFNAQDTEKITGCIEWMLQLTASSRPSASALCTAVSQYCRVSRSLPNNYIRVSDLSLDSRDDLEEDGAEALAAVVHPGAIPDADTSSAEKFPSERHYLPEARTWKRYKNVRFATRLTSPTSILVNSPNTCIATIAFHAAFGSLSQRRMTLWNAMTGDEIWSTVGTLDRDREYPKMAFSECGNYFVYPIIFPGRLLMSVMKIDTITTLARELTSAAVLRDVDLRSLALTRRGSEIRLGWVQHDFLTLSGPQLQQTSSQTFKIDRIRDIAVATEIDPLLFYVEDGKFLYFAAADGQMTSWDVRSGQAIHRFQFKSPLVSHPLTEVSRFQSQGYFGITLFDASNLNLETRPLSCSTRLYSLTSGLPQRLDLVRNGICFPVRGGLFLSIKVDGAIWVLDSDLGLVYQIAKVNLSMSMLASKVSAVALGEAHEWLTFILDDGTLELYRVVQG